MRKLCQYVVQDLVLFCFGFLFFFPDYIIYRSYWDSPCHVEKQIILTAAG